MSDGATTDRILDVLLDADEPLSATAIQRRLATQSRDVTTGVIRDICSDLAHRDRVETTDDLPPEYRLI